MHPRHEGGIYFVVANSNNQVKVEKINTLIDTTGEKKAYVKFSKDTPAIDIATNLGLMG